MTAIHPGITGRAIDIGEHLEPLGVSPRQTGILLNVGRTYVYELIGNGELESYLEGRARKITLRSIRARHERQLAAARQTDLAIEAAQPRRRGRPRKQPLPEATT
jgi:excisionase family DNA binding protein